MNDVQTIIKVGIADLKVVHSPNLLRTSGLGSCVGIVIYDLGLGIAGLAHIMLPDSRMARTTICNDYKYADTAIQILIRALLTSGARRFALKAKIAGGAEMFAFTSKTERMRIGPRNVEAAIKTLHDEKIPVFAKDVGGSSGRTITFYPDTGMLHIRTVQKGSTCI